MIFTKQSVIRWILLSVTILFALTFVAMALDYFGYLKLEPRTSYSTLQIIGLAVATAIPALMLAAHLRGYKYAAGVAILALNFFFPLYFVDEIFRYSMPQAIWLPFALALAICSIRWAVLTFVTTLAVIFAFFPITEIRTPVAAAAITATIFIVLILGRLFQQSLAEQASAAEKMARDSERALRKSEERYRAVFQNTVDAISISRIDNGTYLEGNPAFFKMLGYSADEIIGKTAATLSVWERPEELQKLLDLISEHEEVRNFEASFRRKDGALFWGLLSSSRIDIDGIACRITVTRDITERKKSEELINFLAYFDQLTQLPNRISLMDRLRRTMNTETAGHAYGAVVLIDLDDFKTLNDTIGHESGDFVLKQVAQRLSGCVKPGDTVARLGGDEFIVLLADLGDAENSAATQATAMAEKFQFVLSQEYILNTGSHHNTSSIGVCLFRGHETDCETLLKQVELAMYRAKQAGRNLIRFFDPEMEVAARKRANLEIALRRALLEDEFVLHYQAQIAGGQLLGAEVLVRWRHPQRGMVSPAEFIPLAEETGLIVPLGLWVLESACLQLVRWGADPHFEHLTIAVNVSVKQFLQINFVEQILAVVAKTGVDPKQLKLELTESLMASNVDSIIEKMHALRAKGIRFSLDDFGTGYSSLAYLKRLPLDQLKIDQTFVRDLLVSPDDASIAKTIIKLGEYLGIGVIAEGVETHEHQVFLAELGCKAYQGYLYGRPMAIEDFEQQQTFVRLHSQ